MPLTESATATTRIVLGSAAGRRVREWRILGTNLAAGTRRQRALREAAEPPWGTGPRKGRGGGDVPQLAGDPGAGVALSPRLPAGGGCGGRQGSPGREDRR
jgi:hypothetical protein